MYPANDTEAHLRLLLARLHGVRERLRQEIERSRALRDLVLAVRERPRT